MKIDYVVISSDDNPIYKDFYPLVAKRWHDLGYKTYYINITDVDHLEENEYGTIHKIKSVDFVSTAFQSQVVRLFASNLIDGYLMMSDIDMLPINLKYFTEKETLISEDNVVIYSGQPYGNTPYYPMCYISSKSENLRKYIGIEGMSFDDYCRMLLDRYGEKWNTDENFMYDAFQSYLDKLVINNRDFSRRVDRGNWNYDIGLLKDGYYIDSHMLRPYKEYSFYINKLIEEING